VLKRHPYPTLLLAITLWITAFVATHGQATKVMIGAPPAPNQTVRLRMTQDTDFRIAPAGAEAMNIAGSFVSVIRQRIGERDANGRLPIAVVYEDVAQTVKMNGEPAPVPPGALDKLRGASITMWIDARSQIVDLKAPADFPLPADQLKTALGQMLSATPHREMTVGETVTTPLSIPMPMPLPGLAPGSSALIGETKTTLVRVADEGGEQVATLDQVLSASFDTVAEIAQVRVKVRFTVRGEGTTLVEVRSGQLRTSEVTSTFEGRLEPEGESSAAPEMSMTGTMKQRSERLP
jgi:hypothetical protein